jgi:hypothetical protein
MDDKIPKSYAEIILETYVISFWIQNNRNDRAITLFVEPWGQNFDILPEEYVRIVARGPKCGFPVLSCANTDKANFIYSGWARSVYAVYKNEELISWSLDDCPPEPSPLPREETGIANYKILSGM